MTVDHENHDTLDCRKSNLRVCTISQNGQNRKGHQVNSTTLVRGVYWRKDKSRFEARIRVGEKNLFLGYFSSIESAKNARVNAGKRFYGAFAGAV